MSFEPQNDLERSLMRAASDPAHRPQFYRDLSQSDIFLVQNRQRLHGHQFQIRNMEHDGRLHIPMFSSLLRLQATLSGEARSLGVNALEFMKRTKGTPLLLNPGSDYGKSFTPEEVASIVDGSIWHPESYTLYNDAKIVLGQPERVPTELVAALTRLFKTKQQVKRAWLAQISNPDKGQKPHTLIAIDSTRGFDEVCADAAIVVANLEIPDPPVDFAPITGNLPGLEQYFVKQIKPFYTRQFLGLF